LRRERNGERVRRWPSLAILSSSNLQDSEIPNPLLYFRRPYAIQPHLINGDPSLPQISNVEAMDHAAVASRLHVNAGLSQQRPISFALKCVTAMTPTQPRLLSSRMTAMESRSRRKTALSLRRREGLETQSKSLLTRYGRRPLLSPRIPSARILVTAQYEEEHKFPDFGYLAQDLWKGKEIEARA